MKVGFVGLGRMGHAMATRVLAGGHELTVYNRSADKAGDLVAAGARLAASVAEAAAGAEAVITMLADDKALAATAYGPGGLVESLPKGAIHLVMGTHGIPAVRALAAAHEAAGSILVSAPVLGRPEAVIAGRLAIIAAGPPEAVARAQPVFEALGRRTFAAGADPVAATTMKLANNFLLGAAIQAMAEAFALVEKGGAPRQAFHDMITDGLFACPAYIGYARIIAEADYDHVGFTTTLALKDANLVLEAGNALTAPLPTASALRDRLLSAIAHGDGERDWGVLGLEQARAAGLA